MGVFAVIGPDGMTLSEMRTRWRFEGTIELLQHMKSIERAWNCIDCYNWHYKQALAQVYDPWPTKSLSDSQTPQNLASSPTYTSNSAPGIDYRYGPTHPSSFRYASMEESPEEPQPGSEENITRTAIADV